ncbi:50S ribosomal protein L11 methyltransferase [Segetibacter koreensis]|uniref:50S ribosomal protein L11 methyltransferase n=1 Tax=Segetibacter koreensis TaxID=398037 RepID=UPI0003735015|nr:50S ribosomal protein L11 methyltransferase [Segetibacter koreensis]
MKNTVQITIPVEDDNTREELIAKLSAIEFDAFEEKESELDAFIDEEKFNSAQLENILSYNKLSYTKEIIQDQNWNALWESNFQPVIVDDFCVIRASFHPPFSKIKHEVIITPKMSFGTGHHATTYLMISAMSQIDFTEKQVADFGTGTGVLAILAEKLGSSFVWAIDNDDWSIENSKENIERNNCKNITIEKADGFHSNKKFEIILANINRNIILENAENMVTGLKAEGKLLLSGLLREDEMDIVSSFVQKGLIHDSTTEKNNWICILLHKK